MCRACVHTHMNMRVCRLWRVCMCVCMCMGPCVDICIHVDERTRMCCARPALASVQALERVYVCVHVHGYVHEHLHACGRSHAHVHMRMGIHMRVLAYSKIGADQMYI